MSPPRLYAHPFSSYCQKVLVALYENDVPFEYRMLEEPGAMDELAALWPIKRFPLLRDAGRTVLEASCIIEYLDRGHPARVPLVPPDADAALEVRMLDRFFDNYVSTPQQKIVFDHLRPDRAARCLRRGRGAPHARHRLCLAGCPHGRTRTWAASERFSLADCGAAPFLFYADWTHPIDPQWQHLRDYRTRLLSRPSMVRAVDEARPYRAYFPLGAPDRD